MRTREPEVEHLEGTTFDEHRVGGLEVAVDHTDVVRRREPTRRLLVDGEDRIEVVSPVELPPRLRRATTDAAAGCYAASEMARATKKKTKARPPTRRPAPKKKAPAKTARSNKASASAGGEPQSDVEARWNEYWQCRTALEAAVDAVREAQTALAEAKATERERRQVFDQTKNTLRDLLEVEPASSSDPPGATRSLFDSGARLGVVDEGDEAEDG